MIFDDPHAGFIIASYAVTVLTLAGLGAWIAIDHRLLRRKIAELKGRGVHRRSAGSRGRAS